MYGQHAYATVENLAKVAATKDAEGHVWHAPRMRSASFVALVQAGWIERLKVERGPLDIVTRYKLTASGTAKLASYKPEEAIFEGGHGAKARETFRRMGTEHGDWFHPAIKWREEMRLVPVDVDCPECAGSKWARYDAEGKLIPRPKRASKEYDYKAECADREYNALARREEPGKSYGTCRKCTRMRKRFGYLPTGKVKALRKRPVMIGYVLWPKGVRFESRFGGGGSQCEVCGKHIPSGERVPVAHDKDGKALGMWVGTDCARRFFKVALMVPSKGENPKGHESILDENYVVPDSK